MSSGADSNINSISKSNKKVLLIDIPVIHRGFIDFLFEYVKSDLNSNLKKDLNKELGSNLNSEIGIFSPEIIENHSDTKRDIASLSFSDSKKILESLGFRNIFEVLESDLQNYQPSNIKTSPKQITLINDDVSRSIYKKYFTKSNVIWKKVFLRWDKSKILSDNSLNQKISNKKFDSLMMEKAYKTAEKSSDWWRQVGSVLVKDETILLEAYNQGLPSDYTPYQRGAIRDFMKPGEKPELANYIHSEQKIIANAARTGTKLEGTTLYVTHFPCSVCAKLIAVSGIKDVYFAEGSSNSDGEIILKSAGVNLKQVRL